jgi:hypothetical protein
LDDKLIALGLYRLRGATDNEYPYVYTNPLFETVVTHRDKVFVLGVEVPTYLEGDVYHPLDRDKDENGRHHHHHHTHSSPKKNNISQAHIQRFQGIKEVKEREELIFGLHSSKYCKPLQSS